mmetsp:Transcript_11790/g.49406  ORF Transcript_11790/g.49406 Transcript_11790/m.49406 type:complete len:259 (+) Transcript_11790:30-806(+)
MTTRASSSVVHPSQAAATAALRDGRVDDHLRVRPEPLQRFPRLDGLARLLHQLLHVVLGPVALELLLRLDHLRLELLLGHLDVLQAEELLARHRAPHDALDLLLGLHQELLHHLRRGELLHRLHVHVPRHLHVEHLLRVHLAPGLLDDGPRQRRVANVRQRVHQRLVRDALQHRRSVLLLYLQNLRLRVLHGRRLGEDLLRDVVRRVGNLVIEQLANGHGEVRLDASYERLRPVLGHGDGEGLGLTGLHAKQTVDETW